MAKDEIEFQVRRRIWAGKEPVWEVFCKPSVYNPLPADSFEGHYREDSYRVGKNLLPSQLTEKSYWRDEDLDAETKAALQKLIEENTEK